MPRRNAHTATHRSLGAECPYTCHARKSLRLIGCQPGSAVRNCARIPPNLCNPLEQLSSKLAKKIPKAREISRFLRRKVLWETTWRRIRRDSQAANPDQDHTVVSPDNRAKANRAASPDNTSRRKAAKVRMKQTKTIRSAIVSVVLRSPPTPMDHRSLRKSRPGRDFFVRGIECLHG
jgi:hypothetical protein